MFQFRSKYKNYRLTVVSAAKKIVGETVIPVPGVYIQFTDHMYSTTNIEEAEYIRNLPVFNSEIFEMDQNTIRIEKSSAFSLSKPLSRMNKSELMEVAAELDLIVEENDTNDEIREAIEQELESRKLNS